MADETRVVEADGWHDAVAAARAEGFTFFDWLSAVDRTYDETAPGFDLVVHRWDIAHAAGIAIARPNSVEPTEITTEFQKKRG